MYFILIRETKTGKIIKQEIVTDKEDDIPYGDPFWDEVTDKEFEYQKQYPLPDYEVITGLSDSIEEFLESYPEYQPVVNIK